MLRSVARRTTAANAPAAVMQRRGFNEVHLTEGMPNGKVVPLQFTYHRPAYMVPSFTNQFSSYFLWWNINQISCWVVGFVYAFTMCGGFQGQIPPDPHDVWK